MPIIDVNNLSKHYRVLNRQEGLLGSIKDLFSSDYRSVKAVDGISFTVKRGEIVGFLGPNGAGKSTTIKMMTGILKPTTGAMKINGFHPYDQRKKYVARIGTVFGQRSQLWWDIPVIESFKILREIYRVPQQDYDENLQRFDDLVGLSKLYNQTVRSLSLGQRMLCDIAAAFLHNPEIIFLDEPSIGLDVSVKRKMRALIKELNQAKQTTVILTSHDMGDVDSLCKRIVLIDKGKIIYDGAKEKFNHIFGSYRTLVIDVPDVEQSQQLALLKPLLSAQENIKIASHGEVSTQIVFKQDEIALVDLIGQVQKLMHFSDFKVQEMEMETVIHKVYEGALR